jgi:hypothetical protein
MAVVSKPRGGQKESSNQYMVLAAKVLLVLLILFMLPKLVYGKKMKYNARGARYRKANRRTGADIQSTRMTCEYEVCSFLIPEESLNCVQACISPVCYQGIYGDDPLEDGELDTNRAKEFDACAKEEMKNVRKRRREAEKLGISFYS